MFSITRLNAIALVTVVLTTGCGDDSPVNRWDEPLHFFSEDIAHYHEAALGRLSAKKLGNPTVYVDFSDGLVQAYSSETNSKVVDYISQALVGSSIEWYGLGKNHGGVGKMNFANDRDIYNKVTSPTSYVDIMAPIDSALKKICSSSNDALLITDFEEYTPDGNEQKYAYAKDDFIRWLESGNSITLYYSSYNETNGKSSLSGAKNLYFVVFNYGEINENSLLTKFNKAIEGRGLSPELKKFEINPSPFAILNDYGGEQKTGLTLDPEIANQSVLEVGDTEGALLSFHNGLKQSSSPFEALEFGLSLTELYEYYFKANGRFAKKLYLDASNNSSYNLEMVSVHVTDITDDFKSYIRSIEATQHRPSLIKDEGNNDVWNDADVNNVVETCYEFNTDRLKQECVYSYSPGLTITEVFDFDVTIFSDRLNNSPNEVELITTFHKNFNGQFQNDETVILRVDYVIEIVQENYSAQLESFKWPSIINAANGINESLYQSIRNALQSVKPKGILYSYYLKIEPSK